MDVEQDNSPPDEWEEVQVQVQVHNIIYVDIGQPLVKL